MAKKIGNIKLSTSVIGRNAPGSLKTAGVKDSTYIDLKAWLVEQLIEMSVLGCDPCCDNRCGYSTSGFDFTDPSVINTLTSIVIDGVVVTSGASFTNTADLVNILTGLGYGLFTISATGAIYSPCNHTFGDLIFALDDVDQTALENTCEPPVIDGR